MKEPHIIEGVEGILWIGDPHLKSRRPGRRKESDFSKIVADKLSAAFDIARERRLLPFILGDMFDDPDDMDALMLYRVAKALRSSWIMPWTLVGNHERKHHILTEDTALAIFEVSGLIGTLEESGPCLELHCERGGVSSVIGVGGTPHGQDVPDDVSSMFSGVDEVWWATHHDMAFDGAYPGALPVKEVKGAGIVVNGHMHLTKPPIKIGDTVWYNPGNITRMSIDTKDHTPRVWSLTPWEDMLGIALPFERDAFDMTGRQIAAIKPADSLEDRSETSPVSSVFVEMLKEESSASPNERSEDGVYIMETVFDCVKEEKTSLGDEVEAVMDMLASLHSEAVKHMQSKKS